MYSGINNQTEKKGIAIASSVTDKEHLSNFLAEAFRYKGYRVYQINPSCFEANNKSCFSSIDKIQEKVDTVYIITGNSVAEDMAREAANMGIKKIWINLNYDSPNFTEISKRNGLSIIGGECFYQWNNQVQKAKRFRNFFLSVFA